MFSKLWQWIAAAAGVVVAILYAALQFTQHQRDNAREKAQREQKRADTAEERARQRQEAEDANQEAKQKGEERVAKAVDRARNGLRDHFDR